MFCPLFRRLSASRLAAAALFLSAFALSGCHGSTILGGPGAPQAGTPGAPQGTEATQPPAPITPAPSEAAPGAPQPGVEAGKVGVAVLLPLSGPNASLGNAMLNAAQMALFDVADNHLQLLPHDTLGTPQGAADAARVAVAEGDKLIIGPLLAAEVQAAKPVAQGGNVPMLAFSTATQLAGDGTYLMGFLPQLEIERVASFAHAKGANRFAVLAPRNAYGEVAVSALRDAVTAAGATLDRIDYVDPQLKDPTPVVKRFAAGGNIDALLLPLGGTSLRTLAPLLPYYDIDPEKVHFLGTGLWDDPTIDGEPSLEGGWYAAPPPASRADFETRYRALYHHAPPRLATLAYDATALAAVLARGANGPDFSAAALTNPSGFAGIDGIFRLRPNGLVQRGLAVLEIHRGGSTVIDPAPETFQTQGY